MTSSLKHNLGLNILKNNPFRACLNINGNSNFLKDNKINTIKKHKSKIIIDSKANKSFITSSKKKSYISLISTKNTKNTSSLFLDHTFTTSKNLVLSKLQNKTLFLNNNSYEENKTDKKSKNGHKKDSNKSQEQDINIKSYLDDMKKTLELNLDIITKFCKKDKNIIEMINEINEKIKKKKKFKNRLKK